MHFLTSGAGRRVRQALAVAAVVALGVSPAAGGQSPTLEDTGLAVNSTSLGGGRHFSSIFLASSAAVAGVTVFVPEGYALELGRPAGAEIGGVLAFVTDTAGSLTGFTDGELVVADPARYAGDPAAQACAPGTHAAVWTATLTGSGRPLELPLFVDPAGPSDPAGAAYVLRACPVWPSTEIGVAHRVASSFLLLIEEGLTVPSAPGRYEWSALVTPTGPGALAAEPSRTFEVRATVPLPRVLTVRAKHDAKTKTALISGRLTALGQPEAGVEVEVYALSSTPGSSGPLGSVRTNARGEFQLRRSVARTTEYAASVEEEPRPCTAPSSAPGGCVSQTVSPPAPGYAAVVVRLKTDPTLRVRARDRALAREASLKLKDFPTGWEPYASPVPIDLCPEFTPDLSALTATGEWNSPVFLTETSAATSSTTVYATPLHARTAFRKEARLAVARCVADEARSTEGTRVHSVGPVSFPRVGQETRAFRVVVEDDRQGISYLDLISFRRERVVVHLWLASYGVPLDPLARSLARALVVRARGS